MDEETQIHRIGPKVVDNFRLKAREHRISPVGISVLIGGTAEEASNAMKRAFSQDDMQLLAQTVASARLGDIRAAGFDIIPYPSRNFGNHGRLIHAEGTAGFQPVALSTLFSCFQVWEAV